MVSVAHLSKLTCLGPKPVHDLNISSCLCGLKSLLDDAVLLHPALTHGKVLLLNSAGRKGGGEDRHVDFTAGIVPANFNLNGDMVGANEIPSQVAAFSDRKSWPIA